MTRAFAVPLLCALLVACPRKDKPGPEQASVPLDTTPVNLDTLRAAIPPAAPDTFNPVSRPVPQDLDIPPAPPALREAVEREQAFTQFCYQEFGQKADPTLRGGVAMIVAVGSNGVTGVAVGNSRWSSRSGGRVNSCVVDKARDAWKLAPGAVKPGRYIVQLAFRPT